MAWPSRRNGARPWTSPRLTPRGARWPWPSPSTWRSRRMTGPRPSRSRPRPRPRRRRSASRRKPRRLAPQGSRRGAGNPWPTWPRGGLPSLPAPPRTSLPPAPFPRRRSCASTARPISSWRSRPARSMPPSPRRSPFGPSPRTTRNWRSWPTTFTTCPSAPPSPRGMTASVSVSTASWRRRGRTALWPGFSAAGWLTTPSRW